LSFGQSIWKRQALNHHARYLLATRLLRGTLTWSRDATTFGVFYWRQVKKFDVLLNSAAPNGTDYIDILGFCLHAPPQLFRSNVRVESKPKIAVSTHSLSDGRVVANILIALPLFEIADVLARFDHVSNFIVNAAKFNKSDLRYAFVTENAGLSANRTSRSARSHTPLWR
jgi:hypothetical protein